MSKVKHSLNIRLSSPVSQASAAGGSLLAIFSLVGGALAYYWLPRLIEAEKGKNSSAEPALYLLGLLAALCFLIFLAAGIGATFSGVRRLLQPTIQSDGPEPFADFYGELIPGLKDGKLQFFGTISARLRLMFGQNIVALSPAARTIVVANGNRLIRRAVSISLLGLAILLILKNEWDPASIYPLALLIFGSVALGVVEYFSSLALVPSEPRVARTHQASHHYRGFGHPTHLFNRVPILLEPFEEGFPNRVYRWGEKEKAGTVSDIGEFTGAIFIEKQPVLVEGPASRAGLFLLPAGWIFRLVAALVLIFLVTPYAAFLHQSVPAVLLMVTVAIRFFVQGTGAKSQGETLLETLQFRSTGILLGVTGEMSRADVHVGRSREDSVSSQNVAARSNFTAQFWAGELISEARNLDDRRRLLQIWRSPTSEQWLQRLQSEIETLREERVLPVIPDLVSPEAREMIRANEAIYARRAELAGGPGGRAIVEASGIPPIPRLIHSPMAVNEGSHVPALAADPEATKECPQCAETIKAKARKCRFCGHGFEEMAAM